MEVDVEVDSVVMEEVGVYAVAVEVHVVAVEVHVVAVEVRLVGRSVEALVKRKFLYLRVVQVKLKLMNLLME